ncbi:helix-turn-helix transcriptional regulator [Streptomyces sp. WMMB 322]|uniref:helix-turn-helix domain-containing protein n=1 Tax=Streptomyces sp. WMMB 322 TaxID=1286821 RepID=UPI0006E323D0|nr:helix-turn-helix transcriptional regulator [Streptomyces sp. WMMB 322]SCK48548.1 regulatory protein, luxR family [Streptomyces sp. WMMB 322]
MIVTYDRAITGMNDGGNTMHQHEQQQVSNSSELHVLIHSGLRAHFESPHAPLAGIRSGLGRIGFVDDEDLTAPGGALDLPVLIPVTSEFQAEGLRAVRVRHPLALLVAVTNDVSGFRTYYAIRSGANFVFNMAISGAHQVDMLYAQLRSHCTTGPPERAESQFQPLSVARESGFGEEDHRQALPGHFEDRTARPGSMRQGSGLEHAAAAGRRTLQAGDGLPSHPLHPGGSASGEHGPVRPSPCGRAGGAHAADAVRTAPGIDTGLMRMLCSSMTVSEIARRYYCSERTMYRRIRRLYDEVGVRSRAELIPLASVLAADAPHAAARVPSQRDRRQAS